MSDSDGSGEDIQIRKRKVPRKSSSDLNSQTIDNRVNELEKMINQLLQDKLPTDLSSALASKKANVASEQTSNGISKSSPSKNSKSQNSRRSMSLDSKKGDRQTQDEEWECPICETNYSTKGNFVRHYRSNHGEPPETIHQKKITKESSNSNNPSTSKENYLLEKQTKQGIQYACKLCEAIFNSEQARNCHYTRTHQVENAMLLFFPDGTALVKSSLAHNVSLKPDWFKAAAKRNISSRVCKLCKVALDIDDLKWHYEDKHKVLQMSKVKPIICLNHSDNKTVAEPFKCQECPRTFDDATRLKVHSLSVHSGMINCKFCKVNIKRNVYNNHVKKEHANMFLKKIGITGKQVPKKSCNVSTNITNMKRKMGKSSQFKFKCRSCPRKFMTSAAVKIHWRAMHKKTEISENKRCEEMPKCHKDMPKVAENKQKEPDTSSLGNPDIMYLCDTCGLATTSYDEAVAHSQDHILNDVNTTTAHCEHCNLKLGADYEKHMQLHANDNDFDVDSYTCVYYSYKLLMTDQWLKILNFLPEFMIKIIESNSLYFSTRCIRFKLQDDRKDASAPFTLFQCVKCNKFADPFSIESHVKQQDCCHQLHSYPCELCQRQFYTERARVQHDLTHKVPNANSRYRTVLFNDQSDVVINKSLLEAAKNGFQGQKASNGNVSANNIAKNIIIKVPNQVAVGENKPMYPKSQHEISNIPKAYEEKVATVYKCQCGLCFNRLNCLIEHLENCTNILENETVECKCGLVFDRHNYSFHCKVHCNGFTTIHVKKVTVQVEGKIYIREIVQPEFNEISSSIEVNNEFENMNKGNSEHHNAPMNLHSKFPESINVAQEISPEAMEVTEANESNSKRDDEHDKCSNNTENIQENRSLVATTTEVVFKQAEDRRISLVVNHKEGHATTLKPQENLALVENISTKYQDKDYARQVIDNPNVQNNVRDSTKIEAEWQRNTNYMLQRRSRENLADSNLNENVTNISESNYDDKLDEYNILTDDED